MRGQQTAPLFAGMHALWGRAFSSSVASEATMGGSGSTGTASATRHSRICGPTAWLLSMRDTAEQDKQCVQWLVISYVASNAL